MENVYNLICNNINDFFDLLHKTNISKKELHEKLNILIEEEKIIYKPYFDKYYPLYKATLNVKEEGYAFAKVEGFDDDFYVPKDFLMGAYDEDEVLIFPYKKGYKLINAEVYKIIKRAHTFVIGILKCKKTKKGLRYYIVSNMRSFPVKVNVREEQVGNIEIDSIVKANVIYQGTALIGVDLERIGFKDDPGVEISQIALEYGFKLSFDADIINELNDISDVVLDYQEKNRIDYTNLNVITIDGDDSKDFDDAVYLEMLSNGNYKLYVFIADVSEYVKEGSKLDEEAFSRGTSLYLADRVIPMLPRKLSNGICSLNEGVKRLVLACVMELDLKGNLVNYEITEGVIKSHHRMTYGNVNKILNGNKELMNEYSDIVEMLYKMEELSSIIRNRRYKKGGIEFEVDEYKITLNEKEEPQDIILRTRDKAEKLIEDFMLQANETIAYNMNIMNLPCVYRVHEKPDQEKLHNVFGIISNMGVSLKNTKNDIHPKQIQDALEKISDSEYKPILNNMLLRSMMKAKYHEVCLGHYGLAMNYYCHFTSPIRRYPDLLTHRIIKDTIIHPNNLDYSISHFDKILPEACLKVSTSERKAIECEREVNDMLFAWYMSNYCGCNFTGIITSITSFGMFITLENGIEGLVSYNNMDGYFEYFEGAMEIRSSNRSYKLGQRVNIVVISASKSNRRIDFMLKDDYDYYGGISDEDYMFK